MKEYCFSFDFTGNVSRRYLPLQLEGARPPSRPPNGRPVFRDKAVKKMAGGEAPMLVAAAGCGCSGAAARRRVVRPTSESLSAGE